MNLKKKYIIINFFVTILIILPSSIHTSSLFYKISAGVTQQFLQGIATGAGQVFSNAAVELLKKPFNNPIDVKINELIEERKNVTARMESFKAVQTSANNTNAAVKKLLDDNIPNQNLYLLQIEKKIEKLLIEKKFWNNYHKITMR